MGATEYKPKSSNTEALAKSAAVGKIFCCIFYEKSVISSTSEAFSEKRLNKHK